MSPITVNMRLLRLWLLFDFLSLIQVKTFAKKPSPAPPNKRGKWMMVNQPSEELQQKMSPVKHAWRQQLRRLLGRGEKVKAETPNKTETSGLTLLFSSLDKTLTEFSQLIGFRGNSLTVLFVPPLLLAVVFLFLGYNTKRKK